MSANPTGRVPNSSYQKSLRSFKPPVPGTPATVGKMDVNGMTVSSGPAETPASAYKRKLV